MDLLDLNDDQVYEAPQVSSYTPWRSPNGAEMGLLRRRLPQVRTLPDLQHRHPDFKEVAMDAHFHKWAGGSQIRSKLYELANKSDDYDAADELFSSWKSTQDVAQQAVNVERKERKQTLNAASTGGANGSGEAPSRKIYRRSDIIELMRTNPKRYESMSDEIFRAYQEGRVKS